MSRIIGSVCDCKICYSPKRIHFIRNYIDVYHELAIYMAHIAEQAVRVNVQLVSVEISADFWGTARSLCVGNALPLPLSFSSLWCCCVRYSCEHMSAYMLLPRIMALCQPCTAYSACIAAINNACCARVSVYLRDIVVTP